MTRTVEINFEITPRLVQAFLTYDPGTGDYIWNERARHWFKTERDWKRWNTRHAGKPAFTAVNSNGYRFGRIFNKALLAHRVAHAWMTGRWPPDQIDHLDGNPANNEWSNLRAVTRAENMRNGRPPATNTTGAMGVWFRNDVGKYNAQINLDGRNRSLGCFSDVETAAAAYRFVARRSGYSERHGEGASIIGDTGILDPEQIVDLRKIFED